MIAETVMAVLAQAVSSTGPLQVLTMVAAAVGFLLNFGALAAVFFRIGRVEGKTETRIESLERHRDRTATTETTSMLNEKMTRVELEVEGLSRAMDRRWRDHERKHEDQHHWVANSLQAIALTLNVKLPERRRSADFDSDPEGD